jgi:hypothetical protein
MVRGDPSGAWRGPSVAGKHSVLIPYRIIDALSIGHAPDLPRSTLTGRGGSL